MFLRKLYRVGFANPNEVLHAGWSAVSTAPYSVLRNFTGCFALFGSLLGRPSLCCFGHKPSSLIVTRDWGAENAANNSYIWRKDLQCHQQIVGHIGLLCLSGVLPAFPMLSIDCLSFLVSPYVHPQIRKGAVILTVQLLVKIASDYSEDRSSRESAIYSHPTGIIEFYEGWLITLHNRIQEMAL